MVYILMGTGFEETEKELPSHASREDVRGPIIDDHDDTDNVIPAFLRKRNF